MPAGSRSKPGWLAAATSILIPEIPFRLERVASAIEGADSRRGGTFSIVVVAEGAYPSGGAPITQRRVGLDGFARLGGVGVWLAEELDERIRHEVRATVLGHIQRGGTPTAFDRVLATRLGCAAAWLVGQGGFGKMVAVHGLADRAGADRGRRATTRSACRRPATG